MRGSTFDKDKIIITKISFIAILIFIAAFSIPVVYSDVLYKWVDRKGNIHLTDYPPPDDEARHVERLEVKGEKAPEQIFPEETQELPGSDPQKTLDAELQAELDQLRDLDIEELIKTSEGNLPFPISGEVIQLLEVAGTAIFILMFALSVFINLYFALCIYLIARKTKISYAWMAFVPLLNIFPVFGAAGYRWYVALLITIAVILSLLPFFLFPQFAFIITFILSIALFIFFIRLWMRICENLGISKWLGLLIIIPFINIFLPSYLAFKKEDSSRSVRRSRPAVITFIVFLIIVGAYAVSAPYLVKPKVEELLSTLSGGSVKEEGPGIVIKPRPGSGRSQPQMNKAKE